MTIGLVGCGRWGRQILRDLRSLGCEVVVATESPVGRANAVEGGAAAVVSGVDGLPPVDGIVVATPTRTHAAVIEAALGRGVPVFTEKPMTADRHSAQRLAGMAGDRLFVMDKWRYHPGVEMLAQIARSGEIGPVLGLRTTRAQWGQPHDDVDAAWILAPHDLAIALEILGSVPRARSAVAEQVDHRCTSLFGILGPDPWMILEVSSRFPGYRREITLHCRDGIATLRDGYSNAVQVVRATAAFDPNPLGEARPIGKELPLLRELTAFLDYLRAGAPPRSSAADGAAIVSTVADLRALAGLDDAPGGGR